jgi:hypothetical protein
VSARSLDASRFRVEPGNAEIADVSDLQLGGVTLAI